MKWKKRPTSMLFCDEWFGKRNLLTWEPMGERDEWNSWDFALVRAAGTIEAYTDQHGIYLWQKEDEDLDIIAERKIDPFQQDIDRITGAKKYTKRPGEYFVPSFKSTRSDGHQQTYAEWLEKSRLVE